MSYCSRTFALLVCRTSPPRQLIRHILAERTLSPALIKSSSLCGRGGNINAHPGNLIFRDWVAERKESYQLAKTKMDKSKITYEIFYRVQNQTPSGRFLQKIAERDGKSKSDPYSLSGLWVEIDNTKALAKVSQALREGAPELRAKRGVVQSPSSKRTSVIQKQQKEEEWAVLSHGKRKEPPSEPLSIERMPATATKVAGSMPPRSTGNEHDRGSVSVHLLPLVYVGHYTAPVDESAQAIPPRTMKKLTSGVPREEQISGEWSSPELLPTTNIPPFVSPGFSPYATAMALDTMSLSPNLHPTPATQPPPEERASLTRGHSLSSDGDIHSVGSFDNPFESENGSNHSRGRSTSTH